MKSYQRKEWLVDRKQFDKVLTDLTKKHKRSVAVSQTGGHIIYCYVGDLRSKPSEWWYVDTNEVFESKKALRPCAKCGEKRHVDQPDPCLGWLPGVSFACCGHGVEGMGYIVYNDGTRKPYNE